MLRAKAVQEPRRATCSLRDKVLSSTDTVGNIAGIPVVAQVVNAVNRSTRRAQAARRRARRGPRTRRYLNIGPERCASSLRKQHGAAHRRRRPPAAPAARWRCSRPATSTATSPRSGSIWRRFSAQRHRSRPGRAGELLRHAQIRARRSSGGRGPQEPRTCRSSIAMIDRGYDIVAPIPSCVLMFKQELPLMFPDDADVAKVSEQHVRSVRVSRAAAQGGAAAHGFQARLWARSPTTSPATCACRISA